MMKLKLLRHFVEYEEKSKKIETNFWVNLKKQKKNVKNAKKRFIADGDC